MINGIVIGQSEIGIRQGDPLGGMFYAMGVQIKLLIVNNKFPSVDLSFFFDDGYLHGNVDETLAAFDLLKSEMEKVGQIFDVSKCLVFGNSNALSEFDHPHLQKSFEGLIILGCPYGTTHFMNRSLTILLQNLKVECDYLNHINKLLSAYSILKYCLNTKGTYLARVCTPSLLLNHTVSFDQCIDLIIASWADVSFLTELSSDIRSLPYGLNIPKGYLYSCLDKFFFFCFTIRSQY